jgi:hypothetical protein
MSGPSENKWKKMDEMDMIISLHKMICGDMKYLSSMEAYQQMVNEIEHLKGQQAVSDVRTKRDPKYKDFIPKYDNDTE